MVCKLRKIRHQASRAVDKPDDKAKNDILKLYSKLGSKNETTSPDLLEELEDNIPLIDMGGIIEELHSQDPALLIDGLKKLEQLAELQNIEPSKVHKTIVSLLKLHRDEKVRLEAAKALARIKDNEAVDDLLFVIDRDPSESVKEFAVKALGYVKAEKCLNYLFAILNDIWGQSIRVRKAAAFSIGRLNPEVAATILSDSMINDPDKDVRKESAESLAVCMFKLDKAKVENVSMAIASQLDYQTESDHEVRLSVINAISVSENSSCIDKLISVLKTDPEPRVRGQAAHALSHFFDPRVERALIESLNAEEEGTKKRVALALAAYALRNPLGLHDEVCNALIYIQKLFPRDSYIWKEAVKALPAC